MGEPARQLAFEYADEWIRVDEASALTNEGLRTWQFRAAGEARAARKEGRRPLACKRVPESGDGKPVWHVHRSIDARLTRYPASSDREDRQRTALLTKYPEHKIHAAYRRAHWLREWRKACDTRRDPAVSEAQLAERIIAEARAVEGDEFPISFRTLQLWRKAYYARGADELGNGKAAIRGVEALIDRRGAEIIAFGLHEGRAAEAVEYFYGLYHVQSAPTIRTCHEATQRTATKERWAWPASYQATVKWLRIHDDLALSCLMREGREAWQHRYMPHLEIDHTLIEPGDLFVCDHHQVDFWVQLDGEQLRPWLTAIQDDRSRCIVGWNLGIAPHQDSILCAMRRAFRDRAIPRKMRIDNGKDFTSKLLTGTTKHTRDRLRTEFGADWRNVVKRTEALIECVDPRFQGVIHSLGIELIYAIPYQPWSKGTLERWFGTFEDQCGKTFATYCGNSTLRRPECLEAIRRGYTKPQRSYLRKKYGRDWLKVAALKFVDQGAVPTLEAARNSIAEYIEVYHRNEHRGQGMNEHCPLTVWNSATDLRKAENEALTLLLDARGVYKVGANGVSLKLGNTTLSYGANEAQLNRLRGREVFITLDPDDLSYCAAWTADPDNRRFIARLASNAKISPQATVDDLRTATATVNRRRKDNRQRDREAPARMRNAAAELRVQQRAKLAELRATGTDGPPRVVNTELVRTGFEGLSRPVRTSDEEIPDAYAAINLGDLTDLLPDPDEVMDDDAGCADFNCDDLLPDRTDADGNGDTLAAFG